MHWFDSQLKALHRLAGIYEECRIKDSNEFVEETRQARTIFIDNVQTLVETVVKLPDISGCVAGHEGFILAKAGSISGLDALGAMIQESMDIAQRGNEILDLGTIQQLLVIGENNKVAMISMGAITLAILSSTQTNLTKCLSKKPR